LIVLAFSLTGYLLPWDQKGYWATKVATNILGIVPLIGPTLQKLVMGGVDYGHHTLSRFFALHAGILPASIILLLFWHIFLFRRHGITARDPKRRPDQAFWPDQVLKDAVACLAVTAAVLLLVLQPWLFGTGEIGAELGAPADPAETYSAARPEWYFLFLFEFLKWFPGGKEIWGAVIIPSIVLGLIFLMPLIGRWKLGHRFNLGLVIALLIGVTALTYLARTTDLKNPAYVAAVHDAERDAKRVKALARSQGIPPEGAASLLRHDPLTQGPKLFARNCASCHRYDGHDGTGRMPDDPQSAPDLKGFASRAWLEGLLDPARIDSTNFFGGTKFKDGRMVRFVKKDVSKYTPEQKENLRKVIMALSAEAQLKSQVQVDQRDAQSIAEGRVLFGNEEMRCAECHAFHKTDEDVTGPDLTNYGSQEWLTAFLVNPAHERFYGRRNDRMPKFGDDKVLSADQIRLLVDWLRGDWIEADGPALAAER
jgi:ubiquinol-cytochrome c reductase cytochrome b subunit